MLTKEIKDLLYISEVEDSVLECLSNNQAIGMADLVRGTQLPRMTVYGAMSILIMRGLVICITGRRKKYLINLDKVEPLMATVNKGVKSISGRSHLYNIWKKINELPRHTRVQVIQPIKSLKQSLKKLDWKAEIDTLQKNNLEKSLIFEGIIEEGYYPWLYNFYKQKNKKYADDVIESFIGRATDITFVRDNLIDAKVEMIILPNIAYIANWEKEVAIEIRDVETVKLLKDLFNLAKGYGKKIDQNEYLKKMLKLVEGAD